jgi:geranylgeranyl diphosphate synthase type I
MDLDDLLAWKPAIDKSLANVLSMEVQSVKKESPRLAPFLEAVQEFALRGGKRFRALLILAGYHVAGGKDLNVPLPAAVALETFQGWMLIHDDIIDHGETRRGGPTMHVSMAKFHSENDLAGIDTDFGEAIAITLGDLMESLTTRCFLTPEVPPERKLAVLSEYGRMTRLTALGQLLDIYLNASPIEKVREEDVLTVHRLKSAVYTVSSPLRMGAILAGASPRLLDTLGKVGDLLGVAFQLRDDILGLGVTTEEEVGKSTNDLFEGKRTLLLIEAWRRATPSGREAIEKVLGNPLASPRKLDAAIEVIKGTGSIEYSESKIAELRDEGFKLMKGIPTGQAELLRKIGHMLTERKV